MIAFPVISDKYTTFCSQNGGQRPFWMTENHFWSDFSSFQINTQLFFHKMAAAAILHDRKSLLIAFLAISDQYATFIFLFTKWLPVAILDDRKSLSITFLTISDQYATLIFVKKNHKMVAGGHFGWPKITFDRISRHFRLIRNFDFFYHKMAAGSHFGWPNFTFDCISRYFRSIHNYYFFCNFFHKTAIMDYRKSLSITFLTISDRYVIFLFEFFFEFWFFFFKWPPAAILDDRKSLSIAFLSIADQYATFLFVWIFFQNGRWQPFWMAENRISRHFRSITNFFFDFFFSKWPPTAGGHFGLPKITFYRISRHFRSIRNYYYFFFFFQNGRRWPFWKSDFPQKQ